MSDPDWALDDAQEEIAELILKLCEFRTWLKEHGGGGHGSDGWHAKEDILEEFDERFPEAKEPSER